MSLQGNPWRCSCENVWLGSWLRRWMRETLQLHTSVVERGQEIQTVVRRITCTSPNDDDDDGFAVPLVELKQGKVKCFTDDGKISAAAALRTGCFSVVVALFAAMETTLLLLL